MNRILLSNILYAVSKRTFAMRFKTTMLSLQKNSYSLLLVGVNQDITETKHFSTQIDLLEAAMKLEVIVVLLCEHFTLYVIVCTIVYTYFRRKMLLMTAL